MTTSYPDGYDAFPDAATLGVAGRTLDDVDGAGKTHSTLLGDIGDTLEMLERWVGRSGWAAPSKLFMLGHSYGTFDVQSPYVDFTVDNVFQPNVGRPHGAWTQILPELLGLAQHERFLTATVPSSASAALTQSAPNNTAPLATVDAILGPVPEESLIEGVWYVPFAAVTGANAPASRTLQVRMPGVFGAVVLVSYQLLSGRGLTSWADVGGVFPTGTNKLAQLQGANGAAFSPVAFRDANQNTLNPGPNVQHVWGANVGVLPAGTILEWHSIPNGATGLADPGGLVIVRLGGRVRNGCVGGSTLTRSGNYQGGWSSAMAWRPMTVRPGAEFRVTTTANVGATSISVDGINAAVGAGSVIRFFTGTGTVDATVAAGGAAPNASSIPVNALAAQIPAGSHGTGLGTASGADSLQPSAAWVLGWGINDAGAATLDASAWRESLRAVIASGLCAYCVGTGSQSNIVFANGSGTWRTAPTASGNAGFVSHFPFDGAVKFLTGSVATPPTVTINIAGPVMDGTTVDLFFAALVGSNRGARATVTVDGATPPGGSCVIDTHNVATALDTTETHTVTATTTNGSAAVTATAGTFNDTADVGRYVTGPGIPAGTFIKSLTDSTHATLSQNAGAGAGSGTVTMVPWVPMVKRVTGLTRKVGHQVVVTVNAIDATDGTAALFFIGYGVENDNPRGTVLVHNTARILNTTLYPAGNTDANVATLNAETTAVLAGTASVVGSNTVEPALPSSVQLVDIDAALGKNADNFWNDGIHPNARGQALIAVATADAIRNATERQLATR